MTELILPTGAKVDYRPYRTATTQALMYELQQRQLIAELNGQILLPDNETLNESEEAKNAMRIEQFRQLAAQMGMQIAQSGWALASVTQQPNLMDPEKKDEVMKLAILLVRHPALPEQQVAVAGSL
jgi:hypothetical protein